MKNVIISKEEFEALLEDSNTLNALMAAGVDNWPGFDDIYEDVENSFSPVVKYREIISDPENWWYPQKTDSVWCQEIIDDYELNKTTSDEEIREEYADGRKYSVLWDNLGDAYDDFEKLADAYLELVENKE